LLYSHTYLNVSISYCISHGSQQKQNQQNVCLFISHPFSRIGSCECGFCKALGASAGKMTDQPKVQRPLQSEIQQAQDPKSAHDPIEFQRQNITHVPAQQMAGRSLSYSWKVRLITFWPSIDWWGPYTLGLINSAY
jgi:hypothetical protein